MMVAITVVLAATIGSFVVGLGQANQVAPTASFDITYLNSDAGDSDPIDGIEITHTGGDQLTATSIDVVVEGDVVVDDGTDLGTDPYIGYPWSSAVAAGDTARVEEVQPSNPCCLLSDVINPGDSVEIVWQDPGSDRTVVIGEGTVGG